MNDEPATVPTRSLAHGFLLCWLAFLLVVVYPLSCGPMLVLIGRG